MNRFVDTLNRIRQNANPKWFTPSQQIAYDLLRERLKFLDEVNLWGHHGTGKTFIGWVLRAQGLAAYSSRLEMIEAVELSHTITVDNVGWTRSEVRVALHRYRSLGYEKIVIITREWVQEQMAAVELKLTDEDIAKVVANFRSVGITPYDDVPRNLWDLVSPLNLRD